jgi:hypothetical protein
MGSERGYLGAIIKYYGGGRYSFDQLKFAERGEENDRANRTILINIIAMYIK